MICNICFQDNKPIFNAKILIKLNIKYYHCINCGFLQTEEPYWLEEAYVESINVKDTGIMARNLYLSKITSILLYFLFNKNKKFVDFAGGYGITTRLMRDIGFEFYWHDPHTTNLMARGFEYTDKDKIELVTSFESFEHFTNPLNEIDHMLSVSKNILFSTHLLPSAIPRPNDWWYYGLEHGQHISFYSLQTLTFIAKKYGLNLLTNGINIHLLTKKSIHPYKFKLLLQSSRIGLANYVEIRMKSLTVKDMNSVIERV
jgi:hypothetical protein